MLVKTAMAADADRLYELVCEYRGIELPRDIFDEYFFNALAQVGRRIVLAYQGSELAGFADTEVRYSLSDCAVVGMIHDFFVREPLRKRNIGGGMLLSVTTHLKTTGCTILRAACQRVNISSQEFLEKRGFTKAQYSFIRNLNT